MQTEVIDMSPWWLFAWTVVRETVLTVRVIYFRPGLEFKHILETIPNRGWGSGGKVNARSPPLSEFMQTNGYVLVNGRSPGDRPARPTYYCKNGRNVIDLVFVKASSLSEIEDFEIETEAGLLDHLSVKLELCAIGAEIEENYGSKLGDTNRGTRLIWAICGNDKKCGSTRDPFLRPFRKPWFEDECKDTKSLLNEQITLPESQKTLEKCMNGKVAGPDQIITEFYKLLPINERLYLLKLCNLVLERESVPSRWAKILKERLEQYVETRGLLPEAQMGFRKGRGGTECMFTLILAIQLQLRLGKREVYAIFVDFKRAFDSITQEKLWAKLYRLRISTKMTKIIKSLYDQATIQVRSRNAFSNEFAVTEGVLQGESLIPLLFLLYIADFEDFFRQRGLEGLNIEGIHNIVMLLYTDDTVILAQSQTDLAKKLRVLGEYCAENGLTVNLIKTSIIIFKNGGYPKALDPKYTRHMDKNIETVTTYNYLGIPLSSSSLGQLGAVNAINKAKISSGAAFAILARAKSDYWKSFKHLYDSLISSTLLHGVPVWGLRYLDQIEKAQTGFFK
ncbi:uncharacterized protein LOC107227831 [Neodiprion lecontei]|uniref:Uncharacterized protein LOC107227831 n=1 Tax=Neodiprion lecontei TaxID=441921 RepID=A0A6J0CDS4_NEOLC|nr:uncharacterized protein LOC107227831 [Neodiprion lecontei]